MGAWHESTRTEDGLDDCLEEGREEGLLELMDEVMLSLLPLRSCKEAAAEVGCFWLSLLLGRFKVALMGVAVAEVKVTAWLATKSASNPPTLLRLYRFASSEAVL